MPPTGTIKYLIEDCLAETIEGNMHYHRRRARADFSYAAARDHTRRRSCGNQAEPRSCTVHQPPPQQSRS